MLMPAWHHDGNESRRQSRHARFLGLIEAIDLSSCQSHSAFGVSSEPLCCDFERTWDLKCWPRGDALIERVSDLLSAARTFPKPINSQNLDHTI